MNFSRGVSHAAVRLAVSAFAKALSPRALIPPNLRLLNIRDPDCNTTRNKMSTIIFPFRAGSTAINATGPMSKDEIKYCVLLSDDDHNQAFHFVHRVPEALQQEMSNVSVLVDFMNDLTREHHQELVEAYPWKCVICQQPATSLIHQPQSYIHEKKDPSIMDHPSPICFDGSQCAAKVQMEMNKDSVPTRKISLPIQPSRPITKEVITFKIVILDNFHQQEFKFSHRPPADLQSDVRNQPALVAFMDQVVHEHHRELLAAHPWKCTNCMRPATTFVHNPMSKLDDDDDPQISSISTPICFEGSPCWEDFASHVHKRITTTFGGCMQHLFSSSNRCGYCAKTDAMTADDTLKRCGKCKAIRYCSNECQAADWYNHKKVCKQIAARNNK
jgi:hypothetical protein